MASEQELFDIKQKHLVGKMILTSKSSASVSDIVFPEAKGVFTIIASDIVNNAVHFSDNDIPVLAGGKSDYEGQCLMGVFGPDWSSVDRFINNTKITYSESAENKPETVYSEQFRFGRAVGGQFESIHSEFIFERYPVPLLGDQRVFASYNQGRLYLKAATDDKNFLREAVSFSTGVEEKDITVIENESDALSDQLTVYPAIACTVASTAALKTGSFVEFTMPMITVHPFVSFNIESKLGKDYRLVSQMATVTADFGPFPVQCEKFATEIAKGIAPSYKLDFLQTDVVIRKSSGSQAFVSPETGFAMGIAACENHYNKLIVKTGEKQSQWRDKKTSLDEIVKEVAQISRFDRQDSVNLQNAILKNNVNPLLTYSRGIALSCAKDEDKSASMAVLLHLDNVTLTPVIDHVWAIIRMSGSFNINEERNRTRYVINQTISQLCPSADCNHEAHIMLSQSEGINKISSKAIVRGLTSACFASALSQVLSHSVKRIPVSEQDILAIIENPKGKKEKDNETDNEH